MTSTLSASVALVFLLSSLAQDWRSIVPSKTTRTEVESILGRTETEYFAVYKIDDGNLFIEYSSGPCRPGRKGGWNFPENVVVSITLYPKTKPRLSDLKLDRKKFRKVISTHTPSVTYYINDNEGIMYEIQQRQVYSVEYFPPKRYEYLYCGDPPK